MKYRFTTPMMQRKKKIADVPINKPRGRTAPVAKPPAEHVRDKPASAKAASASDPEAGESVLAQLSPAIEASAAPQQQESSAAEAEGLASAAPLTNEQLYAEQLTGRYMQAAGEVDEDDLYHDPAVKAAASTMLSEVPVQEERRSHAGTLVLVVLVLILAVAAVAGVTMFLKKSGMMPGWADTASKDAADTLGDAAASVPESVATTFRIALADQETGAAPLIIGRLLETDVKLEATYPATGTKTVATAKSKGTVTIVNTTDRSYTFVATTRVLSESGVLLRLDAATPIPANGSVKAAVTADKAGPESDIGPSQFTIPGLGAGFEETIYATSEAAMTGGSGTATAVSVDDIARAKGSLREKALVEAEGNFGAMAVVGEVLERGLFADIERSFVAPPSGTEGTQFTVSLDLGVKTIALPVAEVEALLRERLVVSLPEGANAADYALGSFGYGVEAFDAEAMVAEVRVEAVVKAAGQE